MSVCRNTFAIACTALLLAACAKPLPVDKAAYAGQWQDDQQDVDVRLWITKEGSLKYTWSKPGLNKNLEAPIQEFQGNNFVAGIGPLKTTFTVSEPPHRVGDHWTMVVDGVRLNRPDGP